MPANAYLAPIAELVSWPQGVCAVPTWRESPQSPGHSGNRQTLKSWRFCHECLRTPAESCWGHGGFTMPANGCAPWGQAKYEERLAGTTCRIVLPSSCICYALKELQAESPWGHGDSAWKQVSGWLAELPWSHGEPAVPQKVLATCERNHHEVMTNLLACEPNLSSVA